MVASEFFSYVNSFKVATYVGVEDLADRANFHWNVIVLFICIILVTVRQYFMAPLVCYLPTSVSGANIESYITNLCWVEGTRPFNLTSGAVSHDHAKWSSKNPEVINYYQWVPLMLGLQAIAYYIPRLIWSIFTFNKTGTDLQNLIASAHSASKENGEKRVKTVNHLAKNLELLLFNRREYREVKNGIGTKIKQALPGKRHGNNLIYFYLLIKLLYVLVGLAQIYVMYLFLRFDKKEGYFFFGIRIIEDIIRGKSWTETLIFPRIGICRHTLKHVAADNHLFAQCVLPVNMLNEKIYVFLYFFLGAVMIMTLLSIPLWLYRICAFRQRHFVKRFLRMADIYDRDNLELKELIDRFIDEFLRQDGLFLLRMLSMNAGDLITVEIVCNLFGNFRKNYYGRDFRGRVKKPPFQNSVYPGSQHDYASVQLGNGTGNGFMSTKLLPGGYASTKQRTLPMVPQKTSTPCSVKVAAESPYQVTQAVQGPQPSGSQSPTRDTQQTTPAPQQAPSQPQESNRPSSPSKNGNNHKSTEV